MSYIKIIFKNIQTIYYTLSFVNLFMQSPKVNRFLNGFYTSLVFPIGFVSVINLMSMISIYKCVYM